MPTNEHLKPKTGPRPDVLVALVHEVRKATPGITRHELIEAVKRRAARLRIPYDTARIESAIVFVSRTHHVPAHALPTRNPSVRADADPPVISHREATSILAQHGISVGTGRLSRTTDRPGDYIELLEVR